VERVRSVLDFLGAGNLVLAIIGLLATPFVDRLLIRRKRLSFRVLYNSKIGLEVERLHDPDEPGEPTPPQLRRVAQLLDRMSIVVIRIRNTGSYDIGPDDFERPLSFTFGRRIVWNARVSETASPADRERLRSGLRFFRTDTPSVSAPADNLRTVRDRFVQRMGRWVGAPSATVAEEAEPVWHGVELGRLALRRRERFKLVVVLREPDGGNGELTKDYSYAGKLRDNGLIKRDGEERRLSLQQITGGLAGVLTVLLVLTLVLVPAPAPADPGLDCHQGELRIVGSSVFTPVMQGLAADYMTRCKGARITATATGSIDGVRAVAALDAGQVGTLAALADGKQQAGQGLYAEQLAVVVYHVIVHSSVGVDALTTKQLRGIYDGTYTDWRQLRGGAPLPIRIVGRGGESGTRELFERAVLGTGEGGLSSNDCRTRDRDPHSPVIRCERNTNAEVVQLVSHTDGAIGYADAPSVAQARKQGDLTAVVLDGKTFDAATGVDTGYPFWTVEYLYTRSQPQPDTLLADYVRYLRRHQSAQLHLKDAGYLPCTTTDGAPVELCNRR
jgi:ABC-type phosphate transport system substrate-binding protein